MTTLTVSTDEGDVEIREAELSTITDEDLQRLHIPREDLHRCFAEGMQMMQGVEPGERIRPVADQQCDGSWAVRLVRYSEFTDPLMEGPASGSA
jgi:hypothetical protein